MSKPITIIIIDDHEIVRKALKELIENLGSKGSYKVIAEFNNGVSFLDEVHDLKELPDIFIIDYSMPPMCNGNEVIQKTLEIYPDYKFLLLTQHFEESIINDAYRYDARGFLNKNCSREQLKFAIDNIVRTGYTNIADILKRIRDFEKPKFTKEVLPKLSKNEFLFLELVCDEKEYTYKQIAGKMNHVTEKAVDYYRATLFTKFDVKSKVGLVLYSWKHQLTKPFKKD